MHVYKRSVLQTPMSKSPPGLREIDAGMAKEGDRLVLGSVIDGSLSVPVREGAALTICAAADKASSASVARGNASQTRQLLRLVTPEFPASVLQTSRVSQPRWYSSRRSVGTASLAASAPPSPPSRGTFTQRQGQPGRCPHRGAAARHERRWQLLRGAVAQRRLCPGASRATATEQRGAAQAPAQGPSASAASAYTARAVRSETGVDPRTQQLPSRFSLERERQSAVMLNVPLRRVFRVLWALAAVAILAGLPTLILDFRHSGYSVHYQVCAGSPPSPVTRFRRLSCRCCQCRACGSCRVVPTVQGECPAVGGGHERSIGPRLIYTTASVAKSCQSLAVVVLMFPKIGRSPGLHSFLRELSPSSHTLLRDCTLTLSPS